MFLTIYLWGLLLSTPMSIIVMWQYIKAEQKTSLDEYHVSVGHVMWSIAIASVSVIGVLLFLILMVIIYGEKMLEFSLFTIKKKDIKEVEDPTYNL